MKRTTFNDATIYRWAQGRTKDIGLEAVRQVATVFDCSAIDVLEGMGFLTDAELAGRKVRVEKATVSIDAALAERGGDVSLSKDQRAVLRGVLEQIRPTPSVRLSTRTRK